MPIIDGGQFQDQLEGTEGDDVISGYGSQDGLAGMGGNDVVDGGDETDVIFGDYWRVDARPGGNDTLYGRNGDDYLVGGGGNDTLDGGDGDDILFTGVVTHDADNGFQPVLFLWPVLNLSVNAGFDTVIGGAGYDRAYLMYATQTQSIVFDNSGLGVNAISVGGQPGGSVTGVEVIQFFGGSGNDTITGSDQDFDLTDFDAIDMIRSFNGDVLRGGAGDDVLRGLGGADILDGGLGADQLDGGEGIDIADYSLATAGVTVDLALATQADGDVLTSIEGLSGSAFNDTLRGGEGDDILGDLLGGDDTIEGRDGDDIIGVQRATEAANTVTVDGGAGDDIIYVSGATTSHVSGGTGDDLITVQGDYGQSTITLGAGRDVLMFDGPVQGGHGHVVTDFVTGAAGDVLDLFAWFGHGTYNPFRGGYARLVQSGADTLLQVDTNGGGDGYVTAVTFQNTQASSFTAANFAGYNPFPAASYIEGTFQSNTIVGTSGADDINGVAASDSLRGGDGDDVIMAGDPPYFGQGLENYGSAMHGGSGNDVITGAITNDYLFGGAGADVLRGGDGNDLLVSGDGDFTSRNQATTVFGQPWTAQVHTFTSVSAVDDAGIDWLYAGAGNDTVYAGLGDHADGGEGSDFVAVNLSALGSGLNLDLSGADGNAVLSAAMGADFRNFEAYSIVATAQDDLVVGGAGNDTLTGGLGADSLRGGGGADNLYGGQSSFTATVALPGGGTTTGRLVDDGSADILSGGEGNDVVFVGLGDTADGGEGADAIHVTLTARTSGVDLDLTSDALLHLQAVQGGALRNFETIANVQLTQFDDILRVSTAGNFYGGAGADQLIAGDLAQFLSGEDGDDVITGGLGNDTINGGNGIDTAVFAGNRSAYTFTTINATTTRVTGPDGVDTITGIERLRFADGLFDLAGNPLPNEVNGTPNADTLDGTGGTDLISGGDGDDVMSGRGGVDTLNGGAGTDTAGYANAAGSVTASLTAGAASNDGDGASDTLVSVENLTGSGFADTLTGDGLANVLTGLAGDDVLNGMDGDDLLIGGAGADTLSGGLGLDTAGYAGAAAGVTVRLDLNRTTNDGDGGSDTLSGIENVTGSAFNDTLFGNGTANYLAGGLGRDVILGLGGNDVIMGGSGVANELYGGQGDDTFIVEAVGDSIIELAGEGHDVVQTTLAQFSLAANLEDLIYTGSGAFVGVGNAGNNTLRGSGLRDVLIGGAGDDALYGGAGAANEVYGGLGNDTYYLEAADSVVEGAGEGTDTVVTSVLSAYNLGANVENLTYAGTGAFAAGGNALNNVLTGGTGDDLLRGRGGNDVLIGGAGIDTADYNLAAAGVVARLDIGSASNDGDGGTDTFSGIENLTGSAFDDTLFGSAGDNVLTGGLGRDVLLGLGGNDTLRGGSGAANELYGGLGDDLYIVDASDSVFENAGEGTDTVQTTVSTFTLKANIENLTYVGPAGFTGTGNASDNVLTGANGADTLRGAGGNDTLNGGGGTDTAILSGLRTDYLVEAIEGGWRVTDSMAGRDGVDLLYGMEQLRFSDGSVLVLGTPGAAPAAEVMPLLSDKDGDAFVLPALADDRPLVLPFAAADKGVDLDPLVLPGLEGGKSMDVFQWLADDALVVHGPHGPMVMLPEDAARDGWAF